MSTTISKTKMNVQKLQRIHEIPERERERAYRSVKFENERKKSNWASA